MIHLASRSPRRRVLLDQIGVGHALIDAPIDETRRAGESPEQFVERIAREKAMAGLVALGSARAGPVLAADTAVVLDGRVMGKPRDEAHAVEMLRSLSGRMHRVISTVAIAGASGTTRNAVNDRGGRPDFGSSGGESPRCITSISRVWFREIPCEEIREYCASGEPLDKAGAYAIQGRAAIFVARLDGSFSGVMGLPIFETASLLRAMGIEV